MERYLTQYYDNVSIQAPYIQKGNWPSNWLTCDIQLVRSIWFNLNPGITYIRMTYMFNFIWTWTDLLGPNILLQKGKLWLPWFRVLVLPDKNKDLCSNVWQSIKHWRPIWVRTYKWGFTQRVCINGIFCNESSSVYQHTNFRLHGANLIIIAYLYRSDFRQCHVSTS